MRGSSGDPEIPPDLVGVLATAALCSRPSRPADFHAERRAITSMLEQFARDPDSVLEALVNVALTVSGAESAGISLLRRDESGGSEFYWPAIAGRWTPYVGGTTPRHYSPCGLVLDSDAPQLFVHPERYYGYLLPADPPLAEVLLAPFHVDGEAVGTVWIVSHSDARPFDAEDARRLKSVARCAAGAYQILTSFDRPATTQVVSAGIRTLLADVQHLTEKPQTKSSRPLSNRERKVVQLVAEGHTNHAIADAIGVSVKTIQTYRARASDKLGCRSRADFVRYALRQGWLHGT